MRTIVLLEFRTRTDTHSDFVALLTKILPDTRAAAGFETLQLSQDQDDPTLLVSHETWTSRQAFETYLGGRRQNGTLDDVVALLAEPPSIRYLDILQ
ncbi:MAG TPA: antibiotic biosynthesis monooxygenase [Sporichthyaceae bacterium]|nr:antibiotic biosynthesis monooxygenase [Sporichthyaceae bacterium]